MFIVDGHQKARRLICQYKGVFDSIINRQAVQENKETKLDKLALIQYVDKDGRYDDALCNVFRSGVNNKLKISSYGFLATFLNCSVIVGFTEQPCSEGSEYKTLTRSPEHRYVPLVKHI